MPFALQTNAYETNENISVIPLSSGISERTLNKIANSVETNLVYKNGTVVPIEAVVTVEKLPSLLKSEKDAYSVSVRLKVDYAIADKTTSKTNAVATLKLLWADGFGFDNYIDEVSGTLNLYSGRVTSGEVRYGDGFQTAIAWTQKNVGSRPSFSYSPNMRVKKPTADYTLKFAGESFAMCLKVSSNILQ